MKETNRERKNPIKYLIDLNDEQKLAKQLIYENQIVIITGRAGSGKSLVGAITALDFLNKKMIDKILVTRSAIEVGKSLGYLPGSLDEKFNPYLDVNPVVEKVKEAYDDVEDFKSFLNQLESIS